MKEKMHWKTTKHEGGSTKRRMKAELKFMVRARVNPFSFSCTQTNIYYVQYNDRQEDCVDSFHESQPTAESYESASTTTTS